MELNKTNNNNDLPSSGVKITWSRYLVSFCFHFLQICAVSYVNGVFALLTAMLQLGDYLGYPFVEHILMLLSAHLWFVSPSSL